MKMPARREFFAKLGAIGGLFALAAPAQAQNFSAAPLHQDRFLAKSRLFAGRPMTEGVTEFFKGDDLKAVEQCDPTDPRLKAI